MVARLDRDCGRRRHGRRRCHRNEHLATARAAQGDGDTSGHTWRVSSKATPCAMSSGTRAAPARGVRPSPAGRAARRPRARVASRRYDGRSNRRRAPRPADARAVNARGAGSLRVRAGVVGHRRAQRDRRSAATASCRHPADRRLRSASAGEGRRAPTTIRLDLHRECPSVPRRAKRSAPSTWASAARRGRLMVESSTGALARTMSQSCSISTPAGTSALPGTRLWTMPSGSRARLPWRTALGGV